MLDMRASVTPSAAGHLYLDVPKPLASLKRRYFCFAVSCLFDQRGSAGTDSLPWCLKGQKGWSSVG